MMNEATGFEINYCGPWIKASGIQQRQKKMTIEKYTTSECYLIYATGKEIIYWLRYIEKKMEDTFHSLNK